MSGTRKIIFQGHDPEDSQLFRDQMYLYDTDTDVLSNPAVAMRPRDVLWRKPF